MSASAMTKEEIIAKTISDLSCPPDYLDVVIDELRTRLPDHTLRTCEDFGLLSKKCCETCHSFYPHYDMGLIFLPEGESGWVCCSVRDAIRLQMKQDC